MKSIAKEIRKRVVDAVRNGMTYKQAAKKYGVCLNSAIHWCRNAGVQSHFARGYGKVIKK